MNKKKEIKDKNEVIINGTKYMKVQCPNCRLKGEMRKDFFDKRKDVELLEVEFHQTNNEWEKEFDDKAPQFLSFDRASGSRFLNEKMLKSYISDLLSSERQRLREETIRKIDNVT